MNNIILLQLFIYYDQGEANVCMYYSSLCNIETSGISHFMRYITVFLFFLN